MMSCATGVGVGATTGNSTGVGGGVLTTTCGGVGCLVNRRTARYVTTHSTSVPTATAGHRSAGLVAALASGLGLAAGRPRAVEAEERSGAEVAGVLTTVRFTTGTMSLRSADDVPTSSSSVSSYAPTV